VTGRQEHDEKVTRRLQSYFGAWPTGCGC